jgi:hypothetical protein
MGAHRILGWVIAGAAVALAPACVTSDASRCTDDLLCPSGMVCAPSGDGCVDSDLVAACSSKDDGEECLVAGMPTATCKTGVCQASRCGDGRVTGVEDCETDLMHGQTCRTLGFYEEAGLSCGSDCKFDTSSCIGSCGDGVKNGREQCDGNDLGGATCFTAGFYKAQQLGCRADCTFDVSACGGGRCGDGIVNGLEQCDGARFNRTCDTLGFAGALSGLSCTSNCLFSNQSCTCATGRRCKGKLQRCDCSKFGGCGCVATQ